MSTHKKDLITVARQRGLAILWAVAMVACTESNISPGSQGMSSLETTASQRSTTVTPQPASAANGQHLFEVETFDGNGRTCSTCHRGALRSITPEQVQALFAENPNDPLFSHDAVNRFGDEPDSSFCAPVSLGGLCAANGWPEICHLDVVDGVLNECETDFSRLLTHATIRVPIDLHPNVSVLGAQRRVFVNRGVPTTVDTALDPVLMFDGRAPNLQAQAADAVQGHAQATTFRDHDLDAIAAFESSEFSSVMLSAYAAGGPEPVLPPGNTASEIRGREFYITPETTGKVGFCGMCHSGPMLNEVGVDILFPGPLADQPLIPSLESFVGDRFTTALVSEVNLIANTPRVWTVNQNGLPLTIVSPDIGLAAISGNWLDVNKFKVPSLWGSHERAPFFHDNSAKTVEDMVDHYANFVAPTFRVVLTPQDKADIIAYLRLL